MSVSQKVRSRFSRSRRSLAQVCRAAAVFRPVEQLEERRLMSAAITLVNPDIVPGSNRMIFDYIQNPDTNTPNVVHNQQSLQIEDTGTTPLVISSIAINGPWSFVGATSYTNVTVNPGTPLTVTLAFTQRTLPAHSYNETNYTSDPNGGAVIDGSLTINSNAATSSTTQVALAGYWQDLSNNNTEPSLQTIVNLLDGYQTNINSTPIADLTESSGAQDYGSEVTSNYWQAANAASPVSLQQIAAFRTEGNTASVFWYTASTQSSSKLFTDVGNQGQTLLPTLSSGALASASFNPNGAFGLRVDNEYSTDSINIANGNTGGGGHHFRFFPVTDATGNVVANTYIVAMDYGVLQNENFDFNDNVFIVSNIRPATVPETPSNFTATNGTHPVLSWTADNYSPVSYDVSSSSTLNGTYALLTPTPITATTFTDTTNAGTAVYYKLAAVDTSQSPVAMSVPATVSANTGPVAVGYAFSIYNAQVLTFNPVSQDTDPSGTIVPATLTVTTPNHTGTAVANSNGTITYTAPATYTGVETFTYTVTDSNGAISAPGTITFAVSAPIAVAPVANPEVVTTLANVPLAIPVLSVDDAVTTFNPATVTITAQPSSGQVSVNASNGVVTYTPSTNFVGGDQFSYTVADSNGQVSNAAVVNINVGTEISSAKGAAHTLTYTDENGTIVTISLNKGVADVFFDGIGTVVGTVKSKTTVAGSTLRAREVSLSGTTVASVLTLSGKRGGQFNLGGIADASPMGTINAPGADLRAIGDTSLIASGTLVKPFLATAVTATVSPAAGTVNMAGVRTISLRNADAASFILGGNGVASTNLLFVGSVTDTGVTSTVQLGTVRASKWIKSAEDVQIFSAPSVANLSIAGEFDPDLDLSSTGRVNALGNAHIGGVVSIGSWNIVGNAHSVFVGSTSPSWGGLDVTGNLASFVVAKSGLSSATTAGSINSMSVFGILSGTVSTTGNLLSLRTGQLVGATVDVGNTVSSISAATAANIGTATLRSLVVTGKTANTFSDSSVIADVIGTFSTGPVNAASGTTPEGVAAATIKAAAVNIDGGVIHLSAKDLVSEAVLQSFLSTSGKTLGTFDIDLV